MIAYTHFKKILGFVSFYILPLLLVSFLIIGMNVLDTSIVKEVSISFGGFAFLILSIILFVKPLYKFFPTINAFHKVIMIRRELGVASCYFAVAHVSGIFLTTTILSKIDSWITNYQSPLFFGAIAVVLMVILGITSNNFSASKLRKNWKKLHYLAYPALIFTLLHKFAFEGSLLPAFIISGVFILLKILEFSGFVIIKKK